MLWCNGSLLDQLWDSKDRRPAGVKGLEVGATPADHFAPQRWALQPLDKLLHECYLQMRIWVRDVICKLSRSWTSVAASSLELKTVSLGGGQDTD